MHRVLDLENGMQEIKLIKICNLKDLIFNWKWMKKQDSSSEAIG